MINPHVHCRDWKQKYKERIEPVLSVASRIGSSAVFDMPNTDPAITSKDLVKRRLDDAKEAQEELDTDVFYDLFLGLTANQGQVRKAVNVYRDFFPCQPNTYQL